MSKSIVICAGGTGGHINPGIAIAEELKKMGLTVNWLGVTGGLEEKLVPNIDVKLHTIEFTRAKSIFITLINLVPAIFNAIKILRHINAGVILGLGGYPSLPGLIAGLLLGKRRIVHEQNLAVGLANKLMAPVSHEILTSFKETFTNKKHVLTGNPIRQDFIYHENPNTRFANREGEYRVLIIGGSQGAKSINRAIPAALAKVSASLIIDHAAGKNEVKATQAIYDNLNLSANVAEYFDDVAAKMAKADLVICRSGASTIAELTAIGVASLLIPYPHANSHQELNARVLVNDEASEIIKDQDLSNIDNIIAILKKLLNREKLLSMANNAYKLQNKDAAKKIASICQQQLNYV